MKDINEIKIDCGSKENISDAEIQKVLKKALAQFLPLKRVLLLPPDITRLHSYAGPITSWLIKTLPDTVIDIMPATGTHSAMTKSEIEVMFPGVDHRLFKVHDWRDKVSLAGLVPASFMRNISEGQLSEDVEITIADRVLHGGYDLIISIGQVVPHEVVGMANYNKNILIGCGGKSLIDASHYLGAIYGMERIMGRDHTPVHNLLDEAVERAIAHLPILYLLTVTTTIGSKTYVKSFSAGRSRTMFSAMIKESRQWNITELDTPLTNVVVNLNRDEFRSTWVGNKAIYRTRMAIADGGNLYIRGEGVATFGEDPHLDALIRRHGYIGADRITARCCRDNALQQSRSVAAHLIHGSSEGRFNIVYAPGTLAQAEIESVNFSYMSMSELDTKFNFQALKPGENSINGHDVYYIDNPALGLWTVKGRLDSERT